MVRKARVKEAIEVLGIFSMFALSVFAYLVWWLAFQGGGRVTVDVNVVGEMWLEFLLWLVLTPLITLSMYYYLRGENRTPREGEGPARDEVGRDRARTDRLPSDGEALRDD